MTPILITKQQAKDLIADWKLTLTADIDNAAGEDKVLLQLRLKNLDISLSRLQEASDKTQFFIDGDVDYGADPASRIIFTLISMSYNAMPPEYRDGHWFYNTAGENTCWMFVPLYHSDSIAFLNTKPSQENKLAELNDGITEVCRDCGSPFVILIGEQLYMKSRNLALPKRCKACRASRKCTFGV